jgi:two-component system response regulator GlrR
MSSVPAAPVSGTEFTGKQIVMAVDDEPLNLDIISRALSSPTVEVATFDDARVALIAAPTLRPALVLTDYRMPHLDGVALIQALRREGLFFLAILVTAYADFHEVVAAKTDRLLASVLPKPFRADDLRTKVAFASKLYAIHSRVTETR